MRHALMRIYLNWQIGLGKLRELFWRFLNLDWRTRILALGGATAALAIFTLGSTAWATGDTGFTTIGGALGNTVYLIVSGLVMMVLGLFFVIDLLLVKLLIAIASYNDFVGASAVVTGWPLVRDVTNMFFIVVLLVIAFSTIIGYKEFDYKKYVPRLLLMAVLINFSKTLVGLLIDFSQVIMLTFVNGFKEAAFGNFVKMFGLQDVMTIAKGQTGAEALATTSNLLIAALFGIIMLSVVATIVLIMVIYFVGRVIALWIILIFSPLAFFVWALPPKMQKAVGPMAGQWWSMLASWLTGGPIVAFFLWLTMAVVSANDQPFAIMPSDSETDFLQAAISQAANPASIARFIVATALLMMGLKQAIEASKAGGAAMQGLAQKIQSSGGPIGAPMKFAGRTAGKAAKAGAGLAGRAAGAGVRSLDQKYGLTKSMGQGLTQAGLAAGAKGGFLGKLAGNAGVKYGQKLEGIGGARTTAQAKERAEIAKNLSPRDRVAFNTMNGDKKAMLRDLFEPDFKEAAVKEYSGQYLTQIKKQNPNMSEEQAKAQAKAMAEQQYQRQIAGTIREHGEDKDLKDDPDDKKFIADKLKDDPTLQLNIEKLETAIGNKKMGELTPQILQSLDAIVALAKSQQQIQNGKLDPNWRNSSGYKAMEKSGGNKFKQYKAGMEMLERDPSLVATPADGMSRGVRLAAQNDGSVIISRYNAATNEYTPELSSRRATSDRLLRDAGAPDVANTRFQDVSTATQATAVSGAYAAKAYDPPPTGGYTVDQVGAMADVQRSGVSSSAAFNYDSNTGNYATPQHQSAHQNATAVEIGNLGSSDLATATQAESFVANIDPQVFATGGQASVVVSTSLQGNMGQIATAIQSSSVDEHVAKMESLVKAAAEAGNKAMAKLANKQALDAAEQAQVKILQEINSNADLRKIVRKKK